MNKLIIGIILPLTLLITPPLRAASVYKCEENGNILFSQEPCKDSKSSENIYQLREPSIYSSPKKVSTTRKSQRYRASSVPTYGGIRVRNTSCRQSESGVMVYNGTLTNVSSVSKFRAKLTVHYEFRLPLSKAVTKWDKKEKSYTLKPNQTINFKLTSRIMPNDSQASCDFSYSSKQVSRSN